MIVKPERGGMHFTEDFPYLEESKGKPTVIFPTAIRPRADMEFKPIAEAAAVRIVSTPTTKEFGGSRRFIN